MGEYTVHLVGESNYQPAIRTLQPGDPVFLIAEPDNRFDSHAVRAAGPDGRTIGYIARGDWLQRTLHKDGTATFARVKHIMGGDAQRRSRGVVLIVWTSDDIDSEPGAAAIAARSRQSEPPPVLPPDPAPAAAPPAWPWLLLAFALLLAAALLTG